MTSKKPTPVKKSVGKLKLKKETIRDLSTKGKSAQVKGGRAKEPTEGACSVLCSFSCLACPG